MDEPEVLWARRAFPMAQQLLAGSPVGVPSSMETGWHDTTTHPEAGAFAVVRSNAGFDDLVGEILLVTLADRACFVYVMDAVDVPTDLSLARRAFASISRLTRESIACDVVAVQ